MGTKLTRVKRSDGLRVLSDTAASFLLFEKNNVAEFSYGKTRGRWARGANFEITVPANSRPRNPKRLERQRERCGKPRDRRNCGDHRV